MSEHCILVIEDQEDLAELYETSLRQAGYKVRNAFTGEEGIAEFQASGADVVLLDMTLPEMHGTEVLREIRNLNASVPVIVITAEENDQLREQCERLGVQDYLAKPVNYDAMLMAIQLALETPPEKAELITLRLTLHVIRQLTEIDSNLERAITQLIEERAPETNKARAAEEKG
ncbi:MAG: two-component system, OmpR family, response regulator [Acidobacteriota bacterium]|jgi:DNA-binding response OmpR family regulator|nr:two-component system, OmpR family, response regulator [Acidobacteriota bacterium]